MRFAALMALAAACSSPDATIGQGWRTVVDTPPEPIENLDILFVVDDSGSMATDQYALVQAAGDQLFAQLEAELGGMPDLHIAVVSTDMGSDEGQSGGCNPNQADDGRFQLGLGFCDGIDGTFLIDRDDGAGGRITNYSGTLAETFACIATLGTGGCGFEHPLESMRRALDGSNPENAGFLREDALLLVVLLTDEDDCSAFDKSMFDNDDMTVDSPLGPLSSFRCFDFGVVCDPDEPRTAGDKFDCVSREDSPYMFPVQAYVDFLTTLKPDPSLVMLAGIVPPAGPVAVELEPFNGFPALAGACTPPPAPCAPPATECERLPVAPAVRLDAVIRSFPSRYALESICGDSMPAMLRRIALTTTGIMSAEPCLVGDAPSADAVCRAFDVAADGERTAMPRCGSGDATCFELVVDEAECGHTPSRLRANVQRPGLAPDGSRFVLECLGG